MSYPISDGLRKAGMVFREEFTNIPTVTDNGGVLINSPSVDRGVTLNGVNQYVSYPNKRLGYFPGTGFVVVRFTPDFNWDENVIRAFVTCGTYGSTGLYILKGDTATGYILRTYFASVNVSVVSAEYSPFWNQGQENILAINYESALNKVWLNGNLLVSTNPGMSGSYFPRGLNIGSSGGTQWFFKGQIKSVRIGTKPITSLDVPVLSVAS